MASEVPFLTCASTTMTFLYSRGRFSSRVGQPVRNGETIERRSQTCARSTCQSGAIEELENRMLLSGSVQFDHVLFGTPTAAPIVAITPATGSTSPYGYSPGGDPLCLRDQGDPSAPSSAPAPARPSRSSTAMTIRPRSAARPQLPRQRPARIRPPVRSRRSSQFPQAGPERRYQLPGTTPRPGQ